MNEQDKIELLARIAHEANRAEREVGEPDDAEA
jgi:hypothetical protein